MDLPAAHTDVLEADDLQVVDGDAATAHLPARVSILLESTISHVLRNNGMSVSHDASDGVGNEVRTSRKRCTVFATFLASLARVMGPGGVLKSLVGIWRLQEAYPGHINRMETDGPRPLNIWSSLPVNRMNLLLRASLQGIPNPVGFCIANMMGASKTTSST